MGGLQRLRIAFERIGIKNLEDSVVGLNVDGASVYTGTKRDYECLLNKKHYGWSFSTASTVG